MDKEKQIELNLYSRYRKELMGIAIMMVVVSHVYMSGVPLPDSIRRLTGFGACGVELFLFLSGFGLWKSYSETTNNFRNVKAKNLMQWYKRRYLRILVPYLLFSIPIYGLFAMMDHLDFAEYIRRVFFLSFWTEGWGLWYLAMLIPLYFFAPLVIKLLMGEKRDLWFAVFVLSAEIYAYFAFGGNRDVYFTRFVISRLPSFFIGIYMAQAICEGRKIPVWLVLYLPLFIYILLHTFNHNLGTRFFYLWLLPLPISTIGVWLIERFTWMQSLFGFLGSISLELYCTHVFLPVLIVRVMDVPPSMLTFWGGVGLSIVISIGIHRISTPIISVLNAK